MEYIKIKNGLVTEHISTDQKMAAPWIGVPDNWPGYCGIPENHLDERYCPKSIETLIAEGIIKDNRGTWYSSDKEAVEITEIGIIPPDNCVKEKWNHPTDTLKNGKWVQNKTGRVEYEKNGIRARRKSELASFDKYQMPLLWNELTENQQAEYIAWRNAWLKAPDTGREPDRPQWFVL